MHIGCSVLKKIDNIPGFMDGRRRRERLDDGAAEVAWSLVPTVGVALIAMYLIFPGSGQHTNLLTPTPTPTPTPSPSPSPSPTRFPPTPRSEGAAWWAAPTHHTFSAARPGVSFRGDGNGGGGNSGGGGGDGGGGESAPDDAELPRADPTKALHVALAHQPPSLSVVDSARQILAQNGEGGLDLARLLREDHLPPQPLMVRCLDIYDELGHHPTTLELMRELVAAGADPNPAEPSSGIDVLTRATSLMSLEVATLLVGMGARCRDSESWASLARPDLGVSWIAAALIPGRSVPLASELFLLLSKGWSPSQAHPTPRHSALAYAYANEPEPMAGRGGGAVWPRGLPFKFPGMKLTGDNANDFMMAGGAMHRLLRLLGPQEQSGPTRSFRRRDLVAALDDMSAGLVRVLIDAHSPSSTLTAPVGGELTPDPADNALHILARHSAANTIRAFQRALDPSHPLHGEYQASLKEALESTNQHGFTPLQIAVLQTGPAGQTADALRGLCSRTSAGFDAKFEGLYALKTASAGGRAYGESIAAGASKDDGGWKFGQLEDAPSPKCDIEERTASSLSASEFRAGEMLSRYKNTASERSTLRAHHPHPLQEFLLLNRPVIVRGALSPDLARLWSKDFFMGQHGHHPLSVGEIPYWDRFHRPGKDIASPLPPS